MELSHGEQRQLEVGMARASDPKLMMLDEPAAGLSRAERVKLTELLLALDPSITLILIEHDMDVALRVAEWVTMMHDGRVIVEGTPDEIRANETVHELYLGSAHTMSEQPLLVVADVHGFYGTAHVLEGVNFTMGAEPVALIGRNGMGKSTLCAAIVGLLRSATGSVRLDGEEILGKPAYKIASAGIGYVPQGRRLFQSLTVDEHLQIVGAKSSAAWTPKRVYELFPRLAERKNVSGTSLSGGEQQMLAIGRALLTNPKVLIMDEPSEGLAPTIVEGLVQTIKDLAAEGMGLLVVEQNLGVATVAGRAPADHGHGPDRDGDDGGRAGRRPRGAAALPRRRAAGRRGLPGPGLASRRDERQLRLGREGVGRGTSTATPCARPGPVAVDDVPVRGVASSTRRRVRGRTTRVNVSRSTAPLPSRRSRPLTTSDRGLPSGVANAFHDGGPMSIEAPIQRSAAPDHDGVRRVIIAMNGVTGRMGMNQHLIRSICAIRAQGGLQAGETTIWPEPILVGRSERKLRAARRRARDRALDAPTSTRCLADPEVEIYFDAQLTQQRPAAVRRAIAAGKHVYCEKPVTETLEEALELARLARDAGVKNGVVQDKLFLPGLLKLAELIETGFFGRILERPRRVRLLGLPRRRRRSRSGRRGTTGRRTAAGSSSTCSATGATCSTTSSAPVKSVSALGAIHIPERVDEQGEPLRGHRRGRGLRHLRDRGRRRSCR